MRRFNSRLFIATITLTFLFTSSFLCQLTNDAYAKIEWESIEDIVLEEIPKDMVLSNDGTMAFILGDRSIFVYSFIDNKVTDTIPLKGDFSQISLSKREDQIFLTNTKSKKLSVLSIEWIYDIETGDSPIIGDPNAPVSFVAFLDFQCPFCSNAFPLIESILDKYPKDVKLIIKHFPIRSHKYAMKASIASLAASKQNKYREFARTLFQNFSKLDDENIKKFSEELGLDQEKFNTALEDRSFMKIINADVNESRKLKVTGVPALFINGRRVKNRSLEEISAMIENALKNK